MIRFQILNFNFNTTVAILYPYLQLILRNKGYSYSLTGVMMAIGQVASIILPITLGLFTDRTRRTRSTILLCILISTGLMVPVALVSSVWFCAVALFFAYGLHLSITPMMDGYEERLFNGDSSRYGLVRSIGTMGYVVALLVFGLSGFPDETSNASIITCLVICSVLFILSLAIIPKDSPQEGEREKGASFSFRWFGRGFYLMLLVVGLDNMGYAITNSLIPSYLSEVLDLGGGFSLFIAMGSAAEFVVMLLGGRLLQKGRITPYAMIMAACAAMFVRIMTYFLFQNIVAIVFAQLLHGLTFGAMHIGVMKFVSRNVKKEHLSLAMSFYIAFATNLPQMLGTMAGGFIIDSLGYRGLFGIYSVFPVIALALGLLGRRQLANCEE